VVISPHLNAIVGSSHQRERFEIDNIICKVLPRFLSDTGTYVLNLSQFNSSYFNIENFLYTDFFKIERITPLWNFKMEAEELLLTECSSIKKLSEPEIIMLLNSKISIDEYYFSNGALNLNLVNLFAIKVFYFIEKKIGEQNFISGFEDYDKSDKKLGLEENIINALRLFKKGAISRIGTLETIHGEFRWSHNLRQHKYGYDDNYHLFTEEIEGFIEFCKGIVNESIPDKHFLSVAIRRFSLANERIKYEDEIIDQLICAEALFLSSDGNQGELGYKLSLRAAKFIENDINNQEALFDFMKKVYNIRSKIIHGVFIPEKDFPKKADGLPFSYNELCIEIEKYLRIALKKAILILSKPDNKKKQIDWNSVIFPKANFSKDFENENIF